MLRAAILLLGATLLGHAAGAADDFVGLDAPRPLPAPAALGVSRIEARVLRDHIAWLAAPEREGRGAGSRGLAAAARYVAAGLAAAGVLPMRGVPGRQDLSAYFCPVPVREARAPGGEIAITLGGDRVITARAAEAAVLPGIAPGTIEGPLVFAGFGIREPELGHDDFAGLDVRDRIVAFVSGVPSGSEWQHEELRVRYAAPRPDDRYEARLALLEALGARAAIAIEPDLAARLREGREPLEPYFLPAADAPPPGGVPLARMTLEAAQPILAAAGFRATRPRHFRPAPGAAARSAIGVTGAMRPSVGHSVIGYLPGRDPQLRDEAVMIGAHLDAFGMRGGVLHPGADDNASGVAALMAMARALAVQDRPRRSVVVAFWPAEEAGQLDSSHYVRHPLWPLEGTVAYVNLDMIAHPWSRAEIEQLVAAKNPPGAALFLAQATPGNFAEVGIAESAPWLGDALARAARGTRMTLHLDRTDGKNGGSDYRAFAHRDVPFIRFFGNFFPGYHEPGDTLENLDPGQVERMARLAFATAWLIADAPPGALN